MTHFMEVCQDHGTVLGQCRCSNPSKMKRLKPCPGASICNSRPQAIYLEDLNRLRKAHGMSELPSISLA